jgi:hypothetical protein
VPVSRTMLLAIALLLAAAGLFVLGPGGAVLRRGAPGASGAPATEVIRVSLPVAGRAGSAPPARRKPLPEGMVLEKGRGFTLAYSGGRRLAFEGELMVLLQREQENLAVHLGITPDRDIEVLILTPDLGDPATRPDPTVNGIYDGRIRLYLGEGRPDPDALGATVRHELLHAFLFQVSGDAPAWLHEGLAMKEGERFSPERISDYRFRLMQAMAEGWWVPPLSLQETLMGIRPEDRPMAYAVSLLFVDFLERKYGPSFIPRLLAAMREGKSLEESAREVTGASPAEWERSFAGEMGKG